MLKAAQRSADMLGLLAVTRKGDEGGQLLRLALGLRRAVVALVGLACILCAGLVGIGPRGRARKAAKAGGGGGVFVVCGTCGPIGVCVCVLRTA